MTLDDVLDLVKCASKADWEYISYPDKVIYLHKQDVQLQLVMLFGEAGYHTEEFVAPWANCHADPNARSYYADLYYGASPIKRFIIVYVDGLKGCLPMPQDDGRTVSKLDYKVAEVFDAHDNLDSYMQRSGLALA